MMDKNGVFFENVSTKKQFPPNEVSTTHRTSGSTTIMLRQKLQRDIQVKIDPTFERLIFAFNDRHALVSSVNITKIIRFFIW